MKCFRVDEMKIKKIRAIFIVVFRFSFEFSHIFFSYVCVRAQKKYERTNEQYGYSVHIYVCDSFSQYNDDESESNERVSIKNLEEQPNESIFQ